MHSACVNVAEQLFSNLPCLILIRYSCDSVSFGAGIGMHRSHLRLFLLLFLSVATFPQLGCLFRTRVVERRLSDRPLQTASQQQLIDYVNSEGVKIQSLQATVVSTLLRKTPEKTAGSPITKRFVGTYWRASPRRRA